MSICTLGLASCSPDTPAVSGLSEVTAREREPVVLSRDSTQIYLLFGQSNMWGVPSAMPQDLVTNPRVQVLTARRCVGHEADEWEVAVPPLHGCVGESTEGNRGPGVGPGDYFGRTMAAAFPNDVIVLVPNAVPGVSISEFARGQIAYDSLVARARKSQERGRIRGILFHQGERDRGDPAWPEKVKVVVDSLRADLGIGPVPFLAAELPAMGCCGDHNSLIAKLPSLIENAHVVHAADLAVMPDRLHFTLTAQRTLGVRYGEAMIDTQRF